MKMKCCVGQTTFCVCLVPSGGLPMSRRSSRDIVRRLSLTWGASFEFWSFISCSQSSSSSSISVPSPLVILGLCLPIVIMGPNGGRRRNFI